MATDTVNEDRSRSNRSRVFLIGAFVLGALIATAFAMGVSQSVGTLSYPAHYDSLKYLLRNMPIMDRYHANGIIDMFAYYVFTYNHAPILSLAVAIHSVALGVTREVAHWTGIYGVLVWIVPFLIVSRRLSFGASLALLGFCFATPALYFNLEFLMPDFMAASLATTLGVLAIIDTGLSRKQRIVFTALTFGLLLLTKPTVFPQSVAILGATFLCRLVGDFSYGSIKREIGDHIVIGVAGVILALPYYILNFDRLWTYIYNGVFGKGSELYKLKGSWLDSLTYYIAGAPWGKNMALSPSLITLILVAGTILALYLVDARTRKELARFFTFVLFLFLFPTLNTLKSYWQGLPFYLTLWFFIGFLYAEIADAAAQRFGKAIATRVAFGVACWALMVGTGWHHATHPVNGWSEAAREESWKPISVIEEFLYERRDESPSLAFGFFDGHTNPPSIFYHYWERHGSAPFKRGYYTLESDPDKVIMKFADFKYAIAVDATEPKAYGRYRRDIPVNEISGELFQRLEMDPAWIPAGGYYDALTDRDVVIFKNLRYGFGMDGPDSEKPILRFSPDKGGYITTGTTEGKALNVRELLEGLASGEILAGNIELWSGPIPTNTAKISDWREVGPDNAIEISEDLESNYVLRFDLLSMESKIRPNVYGETSPPMPALCSTFGLYQTADETFDFMLRQPVSKAGSRAAVAVSAGDWISYEVFTGRGFSVVLANGAPIIATRVKNTPAEKCEFGKGFKSRTWRGNIANLEFESINPQS